MDFENVRREDWIVGAVALLLAIDLLFFKWVYFSYSPGTFPPSVGYAGTDPPDAGLGVIAVLAALAILVDLGIERLSPQTKVPSPGGSREATRLVLAVVTLAMLALKFVFHIHFGSFGFGFYAGAVLVVVLVLLTGQQRLLAMRNRDATGDEDAAPESRRTERTEAGDPQQQPPA